MNDTLITGGKIIDRRTVFEGAIFTVSEDTILFSNGDTAKWNTVLNSKAAAVVPVDQDGNIILVEQYRCIKDGLILEIPAGKVNPGEQSVNCAFRELKEETGCKSISAAYSLGTIYSSVGFTDEEIDLFLIQNIESGIKNLDEDEYVNIKKYSFDDVIRMVLSGEIKDSKTVVAILKLKVLIDSGEIKNPFMK